MLFGGRGIRYAFFLLLPFLMMKNLFLKEQHKRHPYGNGSIGKVKYRTEENKILASPEWNPAG